MHVVADDALEEREKICVQVFEANSPSQSKIGKVSNGKPESIYVSPSESSERMSSDRMR